MTITTKQAGTVVFTAKELVRMHRGRRRHSLTGWAWALCVAALVVWWTHQRAVPNGVTAVRGVTGQAHTSNLPLHVAATHLTWNGRPVYRLDNPSNQALPYLQLLSWSDEQLPIIWIGRQLPPDFPSHGPVIPPPVTLAPGQSAWFELGDITPQPLTVLWRQQLSSVYETVPLAH